MALTCLGSAQILYSAGYRCQLIPPVRSKLTHCVLEQRYERDDVTVDPVWQFTDRRSGTAEQPLEHPVRFLCERGRVVVEQAVERVHKRPQADPPFHGLRANITQATPASE